jgi:two-component system response regulator ResD
MPGNSWPNQRDFSPGSPRPSASLLRYDRTGEAAVETRSPSIIAKDPEVNERAVSDKPPRVLLVDDDPTTRNLISHFLRKERMCVDKAGGANEALSQAKERKPDLMIIDFVVQGMGGVELLSILKAAPETAPIPVVVLFPFDEEEAVIKALEAGADFIRKPFSPRILVAKVKKILKDVHNHAPDHRPL